MEMVLWKRNTIMTETTNVRNSIEGAVAQTTEAVQKAVSSAVDKAQLMASTAGEKVEETTAALGEKVQSVADTLRQKGPHHGMLGNASGAVADTLDSAGLYLQEEGLTGMAQDVANVIRRHPIPAVLAGVGIGFLLAKALRKGPKEMIP
jgi:hypothetical protein